MTKEKHEQMTFPVEEENKPKVIRGAVNGKNMYCRIPIRSKLAETMMEDDTTKINAELILAMPHDQAVKVLDAIMEDWMYWLKRSAELYVQARVMRNDYIDQFNNCKKEAEKEEGD